MLNAFLSRNIVVDRDLRFRWTTASYFSLTGC